MCVSKATKTLSPRCDTFRKGFIQSTHLIEPGYAMRPVQKLLGYSDADTSMICTLAVNTELCEDYGLKDGLYIP